MVFFFESSEGYVMYMGADKYENEDLIKYGLLGIIIIINHFFS